MGLPRRGKPKPLGNDIHNVEYETKKITFYNSLSMFLLKLGVLSVL